MTPEELKLAERAMTCLALELPDAVYDDAIEKIIRPTFRHLQSELAAVRGQNQKLCTLISWLDGCEDAFPVRPPGHGLFWWRTEMRRRFTSIKGVCASSSPSTETTS